jgi:hypothetical protein
MNEILLSYEAELRAVDALDRSYYQNPNPSVADRMAYYERQEHLEGVRIRLCDKLESCAKSAA